LVWLNAGLQQLHLPVDAAPGAPATQVLDGEVGVLVRRGGLPAVAAAAAAAGCAVAPAPGGGLSVVGALGANALVFEEEGDAAAAAGARFVGGPSDGCTPPPCEGLAAAALGLHFLRLRVPPAALPGVEAFFREVFGARVEAGAGAVTVWCGGGGGGAPQRLEFVASPPPLRAYDGWHAAIYVHDFRGCFDRAARWGALFDNPRFSDRCGSWAQAAEHHQFRTLYLGCSGVQMELEVRSLEHPACPLPRCGGGGSGAAPAPAPAPRVLSIQSHVVVGCVGNKAATLPLQLLGWDVCPLNTCHLSNHTGYKTFAGGRLGCEELAAVAGALRENGALGTFSAALTGYVASPALLGALGGLIGEVRAAAGAAGRAFRYVCDPVLGDETAASGDGEQLVGRLYVPPEVVPLMRAHIRATRPELLTPNAFEAATLAELPPLRSARDCVRACDVLHALGAREVVITSSWAGGAPPPAGALLLVGSSAGAAGAPAARFAIRIPRLRAAFTGTGDLIAALLLAHGGGSGAPGALAAACELAVAGVHGACQLTEAMAGAAAEGAPAAPELRLVEASALLQRPAVREGMRAFALSEEGGEVAPRESR
jgi:pyridoxine kinase